MQGNASTQKAVLRLLGQRGRQTLDQLDAALTLPRREIARAVGRLITRGYAERLELGCYQVTETGRTAFKAGRRISSGPRRAHTGPRKAPRDTLRQRAWRAMRVLGRFTLGDLVTMAAQPKDKNPLHNVGRYVRALVLAGYVTELPARSRGAAPMQSNGLKVFRLVRNTGEAAPAFKQRSKAIFDHNTREAAPCSSTTAC